MFCPYCGKEITQTMSFCPSCGGNLKEANALVGVEDNAVTTYTAQPVNTIADQQEAVLSSLTSGNLINTNTTYKLVLVSTGTCPVTEADDVIADLIGYTDSQASSLVAKAPVEIVQYLNYEQASVLAQALTEYGLEVSVLDQDDNYTNVTGTSSSIFSSNGTLLASAAAILGTIVLANRVTSFRRHKKPSLWERMFHLDFRRRERVPHMRRPVHHEYRRPEPRPQQHFEGRPADHGMFGGNRPAGGMSHPQQNHGGPQGGGMQGGPRGGSQGGPRGGSQGGPKGGGPRH